MTRSLEILLKFWAWKAAFKLNSVIIDFLVNKSIFSQTKYVVICFTPKAYLTWEYEQNLFFGCCRHILKMFDFWAHSLLRGVSFRGVSFRGVSFRGLSFRELETWDPLKNDGDFQRSFTWMMVIVSCLLIHEPLSLFFISTHSILFILQGVWISSSSEVSRSDQEFSRHLSQNETNTPIESNQLQSNQTEATERNQTKRSQPKPNQTGLKETETIISTIVPFYQELGSLCLT